MPSDGRDVHRQPGKGDPRMIPIRRLERSIPDMAGCAVLIIASSSFLLSFINLQAVAIEAGINPWLSWLWPACIDALLIAGSLMILRSSIRDESPLIGWSVLLSFTAVSTAFNVIHSPAELTAQAAHAVPPVALCVSIELLMIIVRSDLTGHDDTEDDTPLVQDVSLVQQEENSPDRMTTMEKIKHHFCEHPGCTHAAAAEALGVSRSTVSRHMKSLAASGAV